MRKLRFTALCAALMILSGCTADQQTVWETVDDEPAVTAGSFTEGAYTMSFDVPMDAVLDTAAARSDRSVYSAADGAYEIVSETLLASDADSAVRRISGFAPQELELIETTRFDLPEYRFAWCAGSDEGMRLCRADVIVDPPYCYALTFSTDEQNLKSCRETADHVFESLSLFTDEGF